MSTAITTSETSASARPNALGYRTFSIGGFRFERDEYYVHIYYPKGRHMMAVGHFLRALMRDVAWGFFFGTLNFDDVFGTINRYGSVDVFAGLCNDAYHSAGNDYVETFPSADLHAVFAAMLEDWTNEGFDPFAAPAETGPAIGSKHGHNHDALARQRIVAKRMVGLPGDLGYRTDENGYPLNRQFADVPGDQPEIHAAPGFEGQVHGFNMFNYVARSDVTWNPSVVSCVKDSQFCATTEEETLPVTHGNDRVEWFVQISDEIIWDIDDGKTGRPRAKVIMRPGDVAAMPADIRHRGYSPKRSILVVWENNDDRLPQMYAKGELPPYPVEF
jgi:hypothetical protein